MSKSLKVTSTTPYGDISIMEHPMSEFIPESDNIVAILRGVNNAGNQIKTFEIVEV